MMDGLEAATMRHTPQLKQTAERLLPDDFATDQLLEMANLDQEDTNVPGTIFVSTALGSHGPRIKWYPGTPGRTAPCLIMSIEPEPIVRESFLSEREIRSVIPKLERWVSLNHEALLSFWTEGETWNRRRVSDFLDGLQPFDL